MKAARIYQRVSTEEQNLERQNSQIQQAKAEGYYIAGVYKEKASGVRADRPVLNQLIADLQEGDVIITEHIDRISRLPLAEAEKLVARIREKGAFLSIPGIIDLSQIQTDSEIAKIVLDSIQTMLLKIALQTARDDYEQRRNRQAAGIAEAKKQGLYKGRQANIQKHKLIVGLRQNHTLQETAALAGCSVSLVKVVMRQHKQSQIPKEEWKLATLMQKDALIERVASVQALISRKTPYSEVRSEDQIRITGLRGFLYDTKPENIDFDQIAEECKTLHQK